MTLHDDAVQTFDAASARSAAAADEYRPPSTAARLARRSGRVGRRLSQVVVVALGVSLLTFLMLNLLPGDPAVAVLGEYAAPEAVAAFREEHGLDRSLPERYVDWLGGAVQGDLGTSYVSQTSVAGTIMNRLPATLELVLLAQLIALGVAIPVAVLAARKPNSWFDRAASVSAFAGLSMPGFLFAYLLILVFAVQLDWLPATGWTKLTDSVTGNLQTALLPALTLSLTQYAVYVRVLRTEMIDTLGLDFVTTAHGKGLHPRRVLLRHVLRGSLLSLVTVVGVNIGMMLGGAVITESIFGISGLGRTLVDAIYQRDLPTVQGVVLFVAVTYVLLNALVDGMYSLLDPRIRYGSQRR